MTDSVDNQDPELTTLSNSLDSPPEFNTMPGTSHTPANESTSLITDPNQLRKCSVDQLPAICADLREALIQSVSATGGHFAAGLGVVELTVALHFAYDTPDDQLVWDIGHQTYPHKILTGRKEQMSSIRKHNGLSGFPVRDESKYDAFGVAHAGTSISAGLGMAAGIAANNTGHRVVCVIGDGALTEGMVFEALNHAGASAQNMLIVLNDNAMSISPNVGALSQTDSVSGSRVAGFFESLGCHYHGPVDGHNVTLLSSELGRLQDKTGIQVLHILTRKGEGYKPAERYPTKYHAVPPFRPEEGVKPSRKKAKLSYTDVFSQWICDSAADDDRVVAITPAMREGSGLVEFEKSFPDRYHDVGIAEQHAVTFAAGLSCQKCKPVVAIYSSFLQRAYDQFIHDVALQNLDVLLAIDRSGLVGADGATHHGSFDLSFLRCIPNLLLMAPADEKECRQMLQTGLLHNGPAAVRYERGTGPGAKPSKTLDTLPIGKAQIQRHGKRVALLAFGSMLQPAIDAAEQLDATVVNMRFIKPVDIAMLQRLSTNHDYFVTLENNAIAGGAGSSVNEALNQLHLNIHTLNLGLPDDFVSHGSQQELMSELLLDRDGIIKQVEKFLRSATTGKARPQRTIRPCAQDMPAMTTPTH